MKVLIAPDKFKHSLTSMEACKAIRDGFLKTSDEFDYTLLPLADGGDGLSDIVEYYTDAKPHSINVSDPLFRTIESSFLLSKDRNTAFIEMAKASGLMLLNPKEYDCLNATTLGTGELIKEAIRLNVKKIILGIGGSATNDCGIGMAAALGYRFLDKNGAELKPIGKNLIHIQHIDRSKAIRFGSVSFEIACDVKNPLTGQNGASRVYAKQKGASNDDIEFLEKGMIHFSNILKNDLHKDVTNVEGAGAAGGMGAGCLAFLNAELKSGINLIIRLSETEKHIKNSDLVISGEGSLDGQSLSGKVISGLSELCRIHNKPLSVFCGKISLSDEELKRNGISEAYAINSISKNQEDSFKNAYNLLSELAYSFAKKLC